MKLLVITSLLVAIATTLGVQSLSIMTNGDRSQTLEPTELADQQSYTYQRYRGGSGRREILS